MKNIVRYIRQSLSLKLSIGILLMAVPIFVLSLGILYTESRNNIRQEANEHAASVLNVTLERICRYMASVETATEVNAMEITRNLHPDSLLACSRYVVMLNGYIDGCSISTEPYVFPQLGKYFSAYTVRETDTVTTVIEEEYDYFDKVWYKMPQQLGKACWAVYYDEADSLELTLDGMIASYSKPVYESDGRFIGIISTDLSLLHLSRIISEEKPYPDSYIMMTGENGRYLVHPDSTQLFTHTIFSDADPRQQADLIALGHEMTTGKKGSMSVVIQGERCLVSYLPVPETNWSLALVCPERSVLRSYNHLSYIIGPLLVVGLLLILLFSSVTVAQAIRPVNKLAEKLQRIAEGHYDEQISRSRYQDAIGNLQNSFATMQESLDRHVSEIRKMNAEAARRNEELARASELVRESDRQKTMFIQNVSHQIRTPLNIVMGFAQVLRESVGMLSKDESKSIIDMMHHNAMVLDRMVLMLFDSSARGAMEEHFASRNDWVSCNDIVMESISRTYIHFPDLHVVLDTSVPDDFCIRTNYQYLLRSFRELLYNSGKYSDGMHVLVRISETDSQVCFVFEDTGPGIPEEDSERVFETFGKVNDLSEGLGLGLPLTKRHITNLGGDIMLDTTYKEGCRFVIHMPKGN